MEDVIRRVVKWDTRLRSRKWTTVRSQNDSNTIWENICVHKNSNNYHKCIFFAIMRIGWSIANLRTLRPIRSEYEREIYYSVENRDPMHKVCISYMETARIKRKSIIHRERSEKKKVTRPRTEIRKSLTSVKNIYIIYSFPPSANVIPLFIKIKRRQLTYI